MKGFIKLNERKGKVTLLINVEQIVSISDNRSDESCRNLKEWHWTNIDTTSKHYEVMETEEEIVELISKLLQ